MSAEVDVQLKDFGSIFSLEGKVAVVTGGSRGLGLHAASGYVMVPAFSYCAVRGTSVKYPANWTIYFIIFISNMSELD
jgi:hypothetical protein